MKYLNLKNLREIGVDWPQIINRLRVATRILGQGDVVQPVKPYLRYKNLSNRIIAMPAYVGGEIATAGIKWIASFPKNIQSDIPRAHSVIILNEESTGIPIAVINTPLISGIRTAGVTGLLIEKYVENLKPGKLKFGIIGFGPIGQLHLEMIVGMFEGLIEKVYLFDIATIDIELVDSKYRHLVEISDTWQDVYTNSKIFMTCTVSAAPYIDLAPQKGTFHLNVSLRDYQAHLVKYMDKIIVDNWEEICRENTDIERMHLDFGLNRQDVVEIHDALDGPFWENLEQKVIMFNPMGMAAYDIAVGKYYLDKSLEKGIGLVLED